MSLRSIHILFFLFFIWVPSACENSPKVELYSVRDVYPKIVEPGDVLTIEGEGFIEGKAHVTLDGTVKPIGLRPPEPFSFILNGTALSEHKIEIRMSAYQMDALTKETVQFDGVAKVSFPAIHRDSAISLEAQSPPINLEFRPTGGGVKIHALKIREAQLVMNQLGIALDTKNSDDVISVLRVTQNSLAQKEGITAGAKLISVDSFPLFGVDELAGLDLDTPHVLEFVFPEGVSKQIRIDMCASNIKNDEFVAILLTSAALGLFLAFVLPSYVKRTATPKRVPANPVFYILGYTSAAILTVLMPAFVIQWKLNIFGTVFIAAFYLTCAAVLLFYSKQPLMARIVNTIGSIGTIAAIVLMGSAAGNSLGLYDIVASQSGTHFALHIWKNPLMMLASVLAISLLWPKQLLEKSNPFINIAAWLMSICGAMSIVFCCLGGWMIPGVFMDESLEGPFLMLTAIFIFLAKTWLVLLAARSMAGANKRDRRQSVSAGIIQLRWIPMLALSVGAIFLELSPLPPDLHFAGQVISAGIFFTLFSLLIFTTLPVFHRRRVPVNQT